MKIPRDLARRITNIERILMINVAPALTVEEILALPEANMDAYVDNLFQEIGKTNPSTSTP